MPDRRTHMWIERTVLGRTFLDVHRTLDIFARLGPRHRTMPPHDPLSACLMYWYDLPRLRSALLHLWVDANDSAWKTFRRRGGF